MNRSTLDKIQTWCDVACVMGAIGMVIDCGVSRNFPAMVGWICAAFLGVSAAMAHGDVRYWRKRCKDEIWKRFGLPPEDSDC